MKSFKELATNTEDTQLEEAVDKGIRSEFVKVFGKESVIDDELDFITAEYGEDYAEIFVEYSVRLSTNDESKAKKIAKKFGLSIKEKNDLGDDIVQYIMGK